MPRPAKHNWEEIKNYYMAGMSQAEICKKFKISKSTLSERVKIDTWEVSEQMTKRVNAVVTAVEAVSELSVTEQKAVSEIVEDKLKHRALFTKSALNNQAITNLALKAINDNIIKEKDPANKAVKAMLALQSLETHGKITERNKNIVLGKEAETNVTVNAQTNVQNNNVSLTKEQIEEELKKRGLPLNDL